MPTKSEFLIDIANQTCKTRYPSATPIDNNMRCACMAALTHILNPILNTGDNEFIKKYGLTGEPASIQTLVKSGTCPFDKTSNKEWDFFKVPDIFK